MPVAPLSPAVPQAAHIPDSAVYDFPNAYRDPGFAG